jgi:hypothetical protein
LRGNRSYAVLKYWVTKVKDSEQNGKTRVLKRRRSDEAGQSRAPKAAKKASAKKLVSKVVPKPLAKPLADDDRGDDPADMFN